MLRFSCFLAIVLSQSIVDLSARDRSGGEVLVDRYIGSPPSLKRSSSSPAVVGMGVAEEDPSPLLLGPVAKKYSKQKARSVLKDDDAGADADVFASLNASVFGVQKDNCVAVLITLLGVILNNTPPKPFDVLGTLSKNPISTDDYISFLEDIKDLKKRAATAKALKIDGLALVIEKKIRRLEGSVGVACHCELERYKFNWLGPIRSGGRGHLGTAEAVMQILDGDDGDMEGLKDSFKAESSIFLKSFKIEGFKSALEEAIAIDKAKLEELSIEENRLKKLRSFVPMDSMNYYNPLGCD